MSIPIFNSTHKIWKLLTNSQRRATYILFSLMIIGMVLETAGIGLVIPALAILTESDLVNNYPSVKPILTFFDNPSREILVMAVMLLLVCVYTIKALFLAFLVLNQSRFVCDLQISLSKRLFTGYLGQPYTFHLQRNSAQLIRNIVSEVGMLATVNQSVLVLLSEGLVLLGIATLLLFVEPIGAIVVVAVLGTAGWSFHYFTKDRILRWGEARQFHEGLRIQHLQQGLGGVKDVKLLGREQDFISCFNYHNNASANVAKRQRVLQQLPRLWLELLAVIGLAIVVLAMIVQSKPLDTLLPTLGVFAAAAFRLMPSVSKVLVSVQSLRYAIPVINTLYSEIEQFNVPKTKSYSENAAADDIKSSLTLDQINFQYPGSENLALKNICINIQKGESVGFIGDSGSGKSTLVDVILGLLSPTSGTIKVDDCDIYNNLRRWQNQIGYVPQSIYLTDDTLRNNVAFGLPKSDINEQAVWSALKAAQMEKFVEGLPGGLDTIVGERGVRLSGGQRQRIGIARALYHEPGVLMLDEATSSLDSETEAGVMQAVYALQGKKTILIVAHRLTTLKNCNQIIEMVDGKIKRCGTYSEIVGAVG